METIEYLEQLSELSGHLNQYPVKTKETSPDFGGFIKINDEIYRLAAWEKKTKRGKKRYSLQATKVDIDEYNNYS